MYFQTKWLCDCFGSPDTHISSGFVLAEYCLTSSDIHVIFSLGLTMYYFNLMDQLTMYLIAI